VNGSNVCSRKHRDAASAEAHDAPMEVGPASATGGDAEHAPTVAQVRAL
jgi:hypothetical protein